MHKQNNNKARIFKENQIATEFPVGSSFANFDEFIKLFSQSAALKKTFFKIKRRHIKRIELKCDTQQCSFYVAAWFKFVMNCCIITKMKTSNLRNCCREAKCNTSIIKKAIENNRTIINTLVALVNQIKTTRDMN
ncbi:hypothetical protein CDIK_4557 [Cucumispora dikerogammari]|nr:hypothetical protein CDIK_4557 [Cucumispora dikerogammari]